MGVLEDVFECRQCGCCCFGRRGVRFYAEDLEAAASFLRLTASELKRLYLAPGKEPWDIRTDPEGFCLFHQPDGRCLIHAVKPEVCRRWPFLPGPLNDESAFQDAAEACPGLKKGLKWSDFKRAFGRSAGQTE
ncbi:MAG: YkgJ family cysteine cluster protein [Candidatus Adiutrix sp.]|jgi:Fe-S-cluster containining protein|nr:YkgJ family cysteine cluster protein [Candidatus Adiutrix sp.]